MRNYFVQNFGIPIYWAAMFVIFYLVFDPMPTQKRLICVGAMGGSVGFVLEIVRAGLSKARKDR